MTSISTFVYLFLLSFGNLASGSVSEMDCKSIIPGREYSSKNETISKCWLRLGDTCEIEKDESNNYPRCVANSKCVQNLHPWSPSSTLEWICSCEKNFTMTSWFTCERAGTRSASCDSWEVSYGEGTPTINVDNCDYRDGLTCVDGLCECSSRSDDDVCLLGPGETCSLDHSSRVKQTSRCGANSHCDGGSDLEAIVGVCSCGVGYSGEFERECWKMLEFGDPCEGIESHCNRLLGLSCKSGTCQCDLNSPDLPGTCVLQVGRQCKTRPNQGQPASCLKNADCVDGICKCSEGFQMGDSALECNQAKFLGETCDNSNRNECHAYSGLECSSSKICECRHETSADKKSCILRASDSCRLKNATAQCPQNSICKVESSWDPNEGTCTCFDGFIDSWYDGNCHLLWDKGEKCTPGNFMEKHFCSRKSGLDCIGSKCACANGKTSDGKCKLKIGDECTLDEFSASCPLGSTCQGFGSYKSCMCEPGLLRSANSLHCVPQRDYMETCGEGIGICLHELNCLQGLCQCRTTEQVFDPELKECKSRIGVGCSWNSYCPSHSSCQELYAGSSTKQCKCNDGYSEYEHLCKSKYLTTCSQSRDCITAKSMACVDGVCRCSAVLSQIYDPTAKECVGLVGSPCGTRNNKCITGALCGQDRVCRCPVGSTRMDNEQCTKLLKFGAICAVSKGGPSEGNIGCDWTNGLACINRTCACMDPNMEYVTDQGRCEGKPGSICGVKIPVGNCKEEGSSALNFPECNYYNIVCGRGTSCRESRAGVRRCNYNTYYY